MKQRGYNFLSSLRKKVCKVKNILLNFLRPGFFSSSILCVLGLNYDKKGKFVYLERLRRIKFCNLCRYIRVSKGGYATACYYVTSFMIKTSGKIGQCIVEEESAGKV